MPGQFANERCVFCATLSSPAGEHECSFAFRMVRQRWDDEYENRELLEVDIHRGDVSIVTFGANPNTSVEALAARRAAALRRRGRSTDLARARAYALGLRGKR
jgi:phage head maturation protease